MGLLDDAIREHLELKRRRGADATEVSRQETDALGPVRRTPEGRPDLSDLPATSPAEDAEPEGATAVHEVPAEPAPWEDEQTAILAAPPALGYEPPSIPPVAAEPEYEPPPIPPVAAEPEYEPPPIPPAAAAPLPPRPAYEPPAAHEPPAAYDPPPAPASPEAGYEPPPPEPDADFDPFPELADEEPIVPPPAAERGSLLSRFKRRRGPAEEPGHPATAAHGTEPPAAYEPPPPPPPAAYEPPPYPPPAQEPDIVPADDEPEGEDLLEETPDFLEETPEHDRLWFEQRPPRDFDFDG